MQLDRQRIVIRERGLLDLLDLALCVVRAYAGPLTIAMATGVLPAMLFNAWLLQGVFEPNLDMPSSPDYFGQMFLYLWAMFSLVMWEAPIVTSLATLFLGEAVFTERPRVRSIGRMFVRSLPQLFVFQGLLRGLFIPFVATWFLPFAAWPYLNEVILLERNAFRSHRPGQMTTLRRSRALHAGSVGDLFGRWLAIAVFGGLLFVSFWVSMQILAGMLLNEWAWEGLTYTVYYPLALWLVAGYFAVVRFLGYLDLRIRREGWEVELLMRAEGERLTRQLT